jgi:hypothetical protein
MSLGTLLRGLAAADAQDVQEAVLRLSRLHDQEALYGDLKANARGLVDVWSSAAITLAREGGMAVTSASPYLLAPWATTPRRERTDEEPLRPRPHRRPDLRPDPLRKPRAPVVRTTAITPEPRAGFLAVAA